MWRFVGKVLNMFKGIQLYNKNYTYSMKIYLDIDGVLITKDGQPAKSVIPFLKNVTDNHQTYWLTTHCKGDASMAVHYLKKLLPAETFPYLEKIQATDWQTLKTEAIDYSKDFRWLDDYVMQSEQAILARHGAQDKIILVNLKAKPDSLKELMNSLDL
jgi:hypothetical protein